MHGGLELATEVSGQTNAEELGDLVAGHQPQAQVTGALEELMDREVAAKDVVAAVLDLRKGVETLQVHAFTLTAGELGGKLCGPHLNAASDDWCREPVGGVLQSTTAWGG